MALASLKKQRLQFGKEISVHTKQIEALNGENVADLTMYISVIFTYTDLVRKGFRLTMAGYSYCVIEKPVECRP